MIECKFIDLFERDNTGKVVIGNYQQGLQSLFNLKPKSAGLNYDINTRLKNAIDERLAEFYKELNVINEEYAVEKEIETAIGEKKKTKLKLVDLPPQSKPDKKAKEFGDHPRENVVTMLNGKKVRKVIINQYDVPEDKMKEVNEKINDLLRTDIQLNCNPIKLSKLDAEEDTSSVAFQYLDKFIVDDTGN